MFVPIRAPLASLVLLLLVAVQTKSAENNEATASANSSAQTAKSASVQKVLDGAVQRALEKFADIKLCPNQLAVTLVDLSDPQHPAQASYRGGEQIYPASVIKLFYLVAAHRWMEDGKLQDTEELRRAMRDMIVDSRNRSEEHTSELQSLRHLVCRLL